VPTLDDVYRKFGETAELLRTEGLALDRRISLAHCVRTCKLTYQRSGHTPIGRGINDALTISTSNQSRAGNFSELEQEKCKRELRPAWFSHNRGAEGHTDYRGRSWNRPLLHQLSARATRWISDTGDCDYCPTWCPTSALRAWAPAGYLGS